MSYREELLARATILKIPGRHMMSVSTLREKVEEAENPRLVVINPEDRDQVERLVVLIFSSLNGLESLGGQISHVQDALREFRRPPEPGTWAVVEASCVHGDRRTEWVHHPNGNWYPVETNSQWSGPDDWGSLVDPVVLHEGA